jgi:STE24 endopeptidase
VNKDADLALLPVLLLVLQVLFLFNQPVSAALSRAEEAEADNEALQLTQDPAAFCSLMVRLARINQSDVHPPAWVRWFYMHHPSIIERIQAGLVWAKHNGIHIDPSTIPLALERS